MKLWADKLTDHLRGTLLPAYLVSGEEPLQLNESVDAIRAAARARGYTERQVFHADTAFDWNQLLAASESLSLFSERQLLELRLAGSGPGDAGAKAIAAYMASPSPDNLLLITCGKLDKRQQQSAWVKAVDGGGAVLQIWPVEPAALPGWVQRRAVGAGMRLTAEAARLLAERVEGNLLAAAQEIEKLRLLHGEGAQLDFAEVGEAVADSARFDLFQAVDTALGGDGARCVRMLSGLRGEGVDPILVLWAFAREIRSLAAMSGELTGSGAVDGILSKYRVWDKRKRPVRAALLRHPKPGRWLNMLRRAGRIDRMIKGSEPGNAWDELVQLALVVAGVRIIYP